MNRIFICIVLLLSAPVCSSAASLYDTVKKGSDLYAQGKYDEALNVFVDGQIENPEDGQLKFNIASSKYMMKNYEEALSGFLDVAAMARDARLEEKALFNAGNTLYRQGKLEQAVEYYTKALQLDANDKEAQQNLEFVREEIKRRMNEAKKTQEQQEQKKEQNSPNPQQKQQPDNQTSQSPSDQQQKQEQNQGEQPDKQQPDKQQPDKQQQQGDDQQQKQNPDQPQEQQSAAAKGEQQSKGDQQQAQVQDGRDMSKEQAEQLLNSVQENRDNLKEGKQRAKSQGGARSGMDW